MGGPTQQEMNVHWQIREQRRQAIAFDRDGANYRRRREEEEERARHYSGLTTDTLSPGKGKPLIVPIVFIQTLPVSYFIINQIFDGFSWGALGLGIVLVIVLNAFFLAPYIGKFMMLGFSGGYAWLSGNFVEKSFYMNEAPLSLFGLELWGAWQIWAIAITIGAIAFVLQILTLDSPKALDEKTTNPE